MPQPRRGAIPPVSLKGRKSLRTKKKLQTEFEIRIYDQPHYVAGQTPPQPPITLVPPRDTDAFIIDKVVTPFYVLPEEERTVRRVLNYVVGWPDRPLERLLVPCTQILDYVSPRELEDWEYTRMLRDQREIDDAETANESETTQAPAGGDGPHHHQKRRRVSPSGGSNAEEYDAPPIKHPRGPRRKQRGRPRHVTNAPESTEAVAAIATTAVASTTSTTKTLETPGTPSSHLLAQSLPPLGAGNQRTGLPLTLPVPLPFQQLAEKLDGESSNEGGEPVGAENPTAASTTDDGDSSDRVDETGDDWPGDDVSVPVTGIFSGIDTTSTVSRDTYEDSTRREVADLPPVETLCSPINNIPGAKTTQLQADLPQPRHKTPHRVSYVPPPLVPILKPEPKITPILPPKTPNMSSQSSSQSINPFSTMAAAGAGTQPSQKRKHQEFSAPGASLWTPIPQPVGLNQTEFTVDGSTADADADEVKGEDLYEVDCLEDDFIAPADDGTGDMSGNEKSEPVRYFLVRWKGDWPPDQNPTWEPADNLPPRMVRHYLKKTRRRAAELADKDIHFDAVRPAGVYRIN
ncbi:chromatin organization modifier, chromo domain containing protein [Grosmannia clavigera kw1407]|uniref:Chromatin organization modifier, chromo domain containing protein n=1 Tax=Grosmannia clavigera (strain kw1407 / UAMH 11150) TaxID=655863 RepID=F0XQX0_GROCL|nr:chromatin organization modifier, chromo domain containing protein [Grosmannia clavigera kw1407]EFW99914.1 chromatin organization modifier, chromo domain containing protein [Grosmannia clavigera kw1407]